VLERPQTRPGTLAPGLGKQTLEDAIAAFWRHHSRRRSPLRSSVARLAELALASDPRIAEDATRVLFDRIVDPLCDGFTQRGAETYRRMFAQIIMAARRRQMCGKLNDALKRAGLESERDLLRVPAPRAPDEEERERLRKVIVLSRLTLGADVAIAMPILQKSQALFPAARVVFVGTDACGVIARSFSRVTHVPVPYVRSGLLADRLNAWPALLEAVHAECAGLAPEEYVLIDPDSRMTQLGLLRPVPDQRYFHFTSRSYGTNATDPLCILAARWFNETFGPAPSLPFTLNVAAPQAAWARAVRGLCGPDRPLVSVHFGVGGNEKKRAGLAFEVDLLEWLVLSGNSVLLARGADAAEVDETYRLCRRLADRDVAVAHLPTGCSLDDLPERSADVLTWEGSVDSFIATVECADMYIGYDSAGQHIAAALGVPALSLFIEAAGRRHALRWSPQGSAPVNVVRSPWPPDRRELLASAQGACDALSREILDRRRGRRRRA
jgi:ADP-heptose:LPS heptosyltransferase